MNAQRNPFFLIPMIYFPLIILGIEYVLTRKGPYLLCISVFLMAISNFYFFYVIVLLTIIYSICRMLDLYKLNIKKICACICQILIPSLIGTLLSGIFFIPLLYIFLTNPRMELGGVKMYLLYPLYHYSALLNIFIGPKSSYWLCMGFTAPVILALFILFISKNKDKFMKILVLLTIIFVLLPVAGQIFNGLSYISNKWSFAIALLFCYILVKYWENLLHLKNVELKYIVIVILCFFIVTNFFFNKSYRADTFVGLFLVALMVVCILVFSLKWKQMILLLIVMFNIIVNANYHFSPFLYNYFDKAVTVSQAESFEKNECMAISKVNKEENVRYCSDLSSSYNNSILSNYGSGSFYWSLVNPYVANFSSSLSLNFPLKNLQTGYDSRSALSALASMNYYVSTNKDNTFIPYGYELVDNVIINNNDYYIYKSKNFLPIAYCYSKYITDDEWKKLKSFEKQEVMLENVLLSKNSILCKKGEVIYDSKILPYEIICDSNDIVFEEGVFITTKNNQTVTLNFNSPKNSETYLNIEGLNYVETSEYDLYFGEKDVDLLDKYGEKEWEKLSVSKQIKMKKNDYYYSLQNQANIQLSIKTQDNSKKILNYRTSYDINYMGRNNFIINLGYQDKDVKTIKITFPYVGRYTFDSLEIVNIPMDDFEDKINKLKENSLENIVIGNDELLGTIDLNESKILCVTIPYSEGWKAYIDEREVPVMVANEHYIGLDIPIGKHKVKLIYKRPFNNLGIICSIVGLIMFICLYIFHNKDNFKKKKV